MFVPDGNVEDKEAEASTKIKFTNLRLSDMTPGFRDFVQFVEIFFVLFLFSTKHTTIIRCMSFKLVAFLYIGRFHVHSLLSCTLIAVF